MPTLTEQRRTRVACDESREADFLAWEYQMRRRDEITDQSERLASPMENSFDYQLTPEGLVTDLGEPLRPVFEDGYNAAMHQADIDSRWMFEAVRRGIELQELGEIESYARALNEGVRMTSISLDGSDYEGMRAVAEMLGHRLPVDRPGSEDILQSRMWIPEGMVVLSPIPDAVRFNGVDIGAYDKKRLKLLVRVVTPLSDAQEHAALVARIRDTYDAVLTNRTGRQHYAGRQQISNQDAKTFIESQPGLIDAHMGIVGKIFALTKDPAERNKMLAPHRYNFAAALDDRLHGKQVASLSSSGADARAEGKSFDGDCPTSESATSARDQSERLGYSVQRPVEVLHCVTCPFCTQRTGKLVKAKKINTASEKSIQCMSCFEKVDLRTGKRISPHEKSNGSKKVPETVVKDGNHANGKDDASIGATRYVDGRKLVYMNWVTFGSANKMWVDVQAGRAVESKN